VLTTRQGRHSGEEDIWAKSHITKLEDNLTTQDHVSIKKNDDPTEIMEIHENITLVGVMFIKQNTDYYDHDILYTSQYC